MIKERCVCVTPPTCSDNDVTLCYEGDVQLEELSQHDLQSLHITSVIRPHNTIHQWVGDVLRRGDSHKWEMTVYTVLE